MYAEIVISTPNNLHIQSLGKIGSTDPTILTSSVTHAYLRATSDNGILDQGRQEDGILYMCFRKIEGQAVDRIFNGSRKGTQKRANEKTERSRRVVLRVTDKLRLLSADGDGTVHLNKRRKRL